MIGEDVKNLSAEEKAAQARKEYFREWRSKNKEKVKQHNANFWAKRAQQIAAEIVVDNSENAVNDNNN